MPMTREQISTEIRSTEQKLANLRTQMAASTPKTGWHIAFRKDGVLKSHRYLGTSVSLRSNTWSGAPLIEASSALRLSNLSAKGKPYFIIWATL